MKITVFIKEKSLPSYYSGAMREYIKRLSPYCRIQFVMYTSYTDIQKLLSKARTFAITTGISSMTSGKFADKLKKDMLGGVSDFSFIIGEERLECAKIALTSVSAGNGMLAYLLFEQLYRAFMIFSGHPYNK